MRCRGCNQDVDYTDQVMLDVMIRGLSDEKIKRKVFAIAELDCPNFGPSGAVQTVSDSRRPLF